MKFLLVLALLTSVAFADQHEGKKEEMAKDAPAAATVAPEHKTDKNAAYKAAKEACLKENKDLKGKELKECIVSKNK